MTRRLYFHPFGPVKLIDDALLSIPVIVAVITLSWDAVPPGRSCPAVVVPVAVFNRRLARRLQSRRDGVVIGDRHLVPDLEFIEPLRTCGHVDRLELAIRRLEVHHALIKIDGLYGPRKGDGRISPLVRPGLMRGD